MEDSKRDVLQKHRLQISTAINPRRVVEELYSRGLLDTNDREEILAETTTQYTAFKLLDILPRKGPKAFDIFLQTLYHCGYEFLANTLQSGSPGT